MEHHVAPDGEAGYGNPFAPQAWVGGQGYLTGLSGRNVSELTNDAGYLNDISSRTAGAVASLASHNVSELANDAGYLNDISTRTAGAVASLTGHNVSELTNDAGYLTGAYGPANPGYWAGSPPATLAEMGDRLAAMLSNSGATPVP